MFIHLHTHSNYSFLEGLPSPEELVQAAVQCGQPALALTDHTSLTGTVEFTQACIKAGVRPILGLEMEITAPKALQAMSPGMGSTQDLSGCLILLAMDLAGWASLCRLSSLQMSDPAGRGIPFERLPENAEGLICLTGGYRGLVTRLAASRREKEALLLLGSLHELFPGRLYVELQKHRPEDQSIVLRLASLARRLHLPTTASHTVSYLSPGGASLQRLVTAIRLNQPVKNLPDSAFAPPDAYFLRPEEMENRFREVPAAIEATGEIADRCRLELPLGIHRYPELNLPEGMTAQSLLREKAEEGARRLYLPGYDLSARLEELPQEIQLRLNHELAVITECGYESLFLIMEEIVQFASQKGIPISSRGSAASSLVAHCLGITSPDPIRLNLYFERFLNPARATPPDIDTDLCSRRRDEVIHYVYERYGQDRVAMVGTINRFRRRSALREAAKAYGLPPAEIKSMVGSLPYWRPHHLPSELMKEPFAELVEAFPSPTHQQIFTEAAKLIGLPRHLSVHAGGVVIAPGPMTELAPTQLAPKGVLITQFDLESIEALGLVKIDLLGIRGLTVLGDVAHWIGETGKRDETSKDKNEEASSRARHSGLAALEAIPEEDKETSEMVRNGRTIGCFQIESPGMRATLKEIQARGIDDLMVALALYRPGPLTGGLKTAFVRRHRGEEPASQLHPALSSLMADTYGVILYQEQVLRIAHELAGLSLADADLLRRAMSHFDPGEKMRTLQEKFIAGAYQNSGVPEGIAARVWELMAAFAGYGFPKAHAASYALVAWRGAWCKAHYPAVFMAAVLANWGGYYRQSNYLTEARRMGLSLRPPDVNFAQRDFSLGFKDDSLVLFMGLDQVRDLTFRTQARIFKERPFSSLADFLARVDPRPVEAENLARSGALEDFGTAPALLGELKPGWRPGQLPLFSFDDEKSQDWSLTEKVAAQEAVLGVSIVAHPLELFAPQIAAAGALTTVEAAARLGQAVRLAGVRQSWLRSSFGRGSATYLMSLEDLEGMLEVVIPSEVYRRSHAALSTSGPYLVEGVVELNQETGEPFIQARKVSKLE